MPMQPGRSSQRFGIIEFAAGFVAAAAIGVAGAFTADRTVPKWLLVVIFAGGIGLGVGAILWLLIAERGGAVTSHRGLLSAANPLWSRTGIGFTAALLLTTVAAFGMAVRTDPDLSSGYDGLDPTLEGCRDSEEEVVGSKGRPPLIDPELGKVGNIGMSWSRTCNTVWVVVHIDEGHRNELVEKNRTVTMDLSRPADKRTFTSTLELKGGAEGFSDMVSVRKACAQAKVYFVVGDKPGEASQTDCYPK